MKKAKIRCPSCGSSQAYIRIKTGKIVCTSCGDISLIQGETRRETYKETTHQ